MFEIKFQNPQERLKNERRSKLIDPESALYKVLGQKRNELLLKYPNQIADKRMDFHIELINNRENATDELLISRANSMHGLSCPEKYTVLGQAYVLSTPNNTHITVAYFPKGVPNELKMSI
jgi:hypothetical protein